jgi:segregation and condensation protein A
MNIQQEYKVRTDVFEGPMDLLVHLIRKNEVDIYDIPIGLIIEQYLQYIEWMKSLSIDFAGEFLVMAATLTHIKSRMLLPVHSDVDEEDEDPLLEITRSLEEYLKFKSAAEQLAERHLLGRDTFCRKVEKNEILADRGEEMIHVGLFELIDAFQTILEKVSADHKVDFTTERISIKERMTQIIEVLEKQGSITFMELFSGAIEKSDIIVTFLSLLEMIKMNLVTITQNVQSGIIRIFYQ